MRVSVIITTYNRPDYLKQSIGSVLAQTWGDVQLIVVDDCSPEPPDVPDSVLLVRHARNLGAGAARNTGLAHVDGDLVMFLDDDDWVHPDRIRWAVEQIGDHRTHACAAELVWPDRTKAAGLRFEGDQRATFPADGQPAIGQCVHRVEDVEQFDPTMRAGQDSEWWVRMGHAADFAWCDETGFYYRQHDQERSDRGAARRLESRLQIRYRNRHTDRHTRAMLSAKVAAGHYWCGHRARGLWWSLRALTERPTMDAVRLVGHVIR